MRFIFAFLTEIEVDEAHCRHQRKIILPASRVHLVFHHPIHFATRQRTPIAPSNQQALR
ncbi:hypothetical protein RISK_002571 [Rhodopirellula islandica]|uniref:Uncharacterized protein n=1 Tax=Rhodopirellula islandica TaxID=595434 RepID=A0A0J1EIM4_RHOIS|nr:hypothetical protein RISK_002571 [Rhodopirellula islandica]